jgi:hypothetical protein
MGESAFSEVPHDPAGLEPCFGIGLAVEGPLQFGERFGNAVQLDQSADQVETDCGVGGAIGEDLAEVLFGGLELALLKQLNPGLGAGRRKQYPEKR